MVTMILVAFGAFWFGFFLASLLAITKDGKE